MFKSKLEVDRHVNNCIKKINSDTQRNLRGFSFGKLYFSVGDYEQACRYVQSYLSVKPKSAEGYVLLGKCLEKLGKIDAALDAYRNSLQIEPKQNSIIVKVCELMATDNIDMDFSGARYFCDLAQSFDPNNPAVYCLKEKLITKENDNPVKITEFLLRELETRPSDVNLRIRLLKHFLQNNMVLEAYKHASAIEEKHFSIFSENLHWYETFADILQRFQKEQPAASVNTWGFLSLSVSILEKLVALGMEEYHNNTNLFMKYVTSLFDFDQMLFKAHTNKKSFKTDPNLISLFFKHYQAQLYFHIATLIFKEAKRNDLDFKEASNFVLPLLFTAYHATLPDLNSMWIIQSLDNIKRLVNGWYQTGCYRNSQMGHIILESAKIGKSWLLEKATRYSSGCWRENLYKKLFVSRDCQIKMSSSFFTTNNFTIEPTIQLPYLEDLVKYDEIAQTLYPDSLHHYIWIVLNSNIPDVNIRTFEGLQYSSTNLTNCGPESLNVLDIYSFVYCASLCSSTRVKDNKHKDCGLLPASVTENLATVDQTKILKAAYKMYKNLQSSDPSDRVLITKVIETIRCLGHHGLDVKLLALVANFFEERAKRLTLRSEIDATLARAELYWKTAIPLLEKTKNDEAIGYSKNRIFEYKTEKLTSSEIESFLERGNLFIATQLVKKKDFEKAVTIFSELKDPYATFYQYEVYKTLADNKKRANMGNLDSSTSEYESLLNKAKDCLYLTLDRLRDPSHNSSHPLNSQLGTEITTIEKLISEIDGTQADFNDPEESLNLSRSRLFESHSTPMRFKIERQEARPSPERLDAQIRQIMATKDANISLLTEQTKIIAETQKNVLEKLGLVIDELKNIKLDIVNLKEATKGIDEIKNTKDDIQNMVDVIQEIKKDLNEVKKNDAKNQLSDEDLYALDADYGVDYNIAANISTNLPGTYSNYPPGRIPNPNHISAYGPLMYPGLYPGLPYTYGGLNFAQPGALPFLPDPQAPAIVPTSLPLTNILTPPINTKFGVDLRKSQPPTLANLLSKEEATVSTTTINQLKFSPLPTVPSLTAHSSSILPLTTTSTSMPPLTSNLSAAAPSMATAFGKAPPVNVVITTSDPLPSRNVVTSQPILSVTIPPQHMKSNFSKLATTSLVTGSPLITSTRIDTLNIEKNEDKTLDLSSTSINSLENEEPNIEFKPIIPLPDEVPVVTGEENEEQEFSARAKLFRHVNINGNKEWKERGVGILKILHNKQTGKHRILMRRDQVLKICANHIIQQDMTLVPMTNSDRSFMWIAHDFSDDELQVETFCVKFKSAEEAKQFEEAVKKVKDEIGKNKDQGTPKLYPPPVEKETVTPNPFQTPNSNSLGGFVFTSTPTFKPKEIAPITVAPEKPKETTGSPFSTFVFGKDNLKKDEESKTFSPFIISQEKKVEDGDVEEFVPTAEFKPVVPLPELVEVKTGEEESKVLFEARTKLFRYSVETKEWKERGVGTIKILKDQDHIRLLMRRDQVHKVCCNHRVLKDMIFKTNSNNPKAVVWHAKDFSDEELKTETFTARFKTDEIAGQFLKTLQDEQKNMDENNTRDDKTVKGDKEEVPKESRYGLNKNDQQSRPTISTDVGFGDRFKLKPGAWECNSCLIRNTEDVEKCVACNTPKDGINTNPTISKPSATFMFGANANALKPASGSKAEAGFGDVFKAKPGTWECKTCLIRNEGSESKCMACDTPKEGVVIKPTVPKPSATFTFGSNPLKLATDDKADVGFGDLFKAKPGSWECNICLIRNEGNVQECVACNTPKEGAVKQVTETPKPTSTWLFGMPSTTAAATKVLTTPENKTPFSTSNTNTGTSLFSTGPAFFFGSNQTDETKISNASQGDAVLGGKNSNITDSKWTFGQQSVSTPPSNRSPLLSQKTDIASVKSSLDNSASHGSFIFGTGQKEGFEFKQRTPRRISSGPNEESDGSYVEEEEDTIYFKPIIPLPDKVQVKTGEEDEEVLYCHRAKLFRFVSGEWKERGIGDVKILKNNVTKKLRVVMRRDQVLKICLNHILTKDIEYKLKDERSFMFATADFSEGELVNEQFCLRFKNGEIAKEFLKAASDALEGFSQIKKLETANTSESDDEPVITFETKVTPEEEELAISLGLPPKFMSYKQLPDCKCEQCKKDDEYLKDLFDTNSSTIKNNFSFASPTSNVFGSFSLKPPVLSTSSAFVKPAGDSTPATFTFSAPTSSSLFTSNPSGSIFSSNNSIFGKASASNFSFNSFSNNSNNLFSSIQGPNSDAITTKPFTFDTNVTSKSIFGGTSSNITPTTGNSNIFGGTKNIFSDPPSTNTKSIFPEPNSSGTKSIIADPLSSGTKIILADPFSSGTKSVFADSLQSGNKTIFGNTACGPGNTNKETSQKTLQEILSTNVEEIEEPVLKCDSGLSFASLAATSNDTKPAFAKKNDDAFVFVGAGAPVFGSQKPKAAAGVDTSQNEDENDTPNNDNEYDPHYEPIIPLPDQIVVTTGEEDEEILFNERAKLFRYDVDTKEWKERGIGQLKILQHSEKHTFRLLLRREQVFKIVLNQLVTPNFELQQMLTSDKAWMWAGHNYTDDEYRLEKLAVRFKNEELAAQFKAVIDDVVTKLQNAPQKQKEELPVFVQNFADEEGDDNAEEESYKDENDVANDDDYIEEEEDDDERTVMFMKECVLSELEADNEWHPVGQGVLQVYYDPELYAAKIQVTDNDEGRVLSSTVIGVNTLMDITGNECSWKATEWATNDVQWRNLKATFDSELGAQEFHSNYIESLNYAQQVGLIDEIPDDYDPED